MRKSTFVWMLFLAAIMPATATAGFTRPDLKEICHCTLRREDRCFTKLVPENRFDFHLQNHPKDRAGACTSVPQECVPPPRPTPSSNTEPSDDESGWSSPSIASLQDFDEHGFNPAGQPIVIALSCPTLVNDTKSIVVYDNDLPLAFDALEVTPNRVTIPAGLPAGRHELTLVANDSFGAPIKASFVLWLGQFSIQVLVVDEAGNPQGNAEVVARLSDDPTVVSKIATGNDGRGTFTNLPQRSFDLIATTSDNRLATHPTSFDAGSVTMVVRGFQAPSSIDNNDFSQGTAGWEIGDAPVTIIPHVEGAASTSFTTVAAAEEDYDLQLETSGEGEQSISRTIEVEAGIKTVRVRFRFITSEVPGGYFGTEYNDFFNVSIRGQLGSSVIAGNSMNGLGLEAFDANGATAWFTSELEIPPGGDVIQVDIGVANVGDGLFDSQVIVDAIEEDGLAITTLELADIDNRPLEFLSVSPHSYFGGNTRVHGKLVVKGPPDAVLEEVKLEIIEGTGPVASGDLAGTLGTSLLREFGESEEISSGGTQLLFEIPAAALAAVNQTSNGNVTLRVKVRTDDGNEAEKDYAQAVGKLVLLGSSGPMLRYGGRSEDLGGDDWMKPSVRSVIESTTHMWGDFSNMNGGPFSPHSNHDTGNSADGWFAGYNARDAATAAAIIAQLNQHGTRIRTVFVTFTTDFENAIDGVTLTDGRTATSVIRDRADHDTHFHWEVTD